MASPVTGTSRRYLSLGFGPIHVSSRAGTGRSDVAVARVANRDLTVVSAVAAIVGVGDRLLKRERRLRGVAVSIVAVVVAVVT